MKDLFGDERRVTRRHDLVDLVLVYHHATELALLLSETGDEDEAEWIPKSQCEVDEDRTPLSRVRRGDVITVTMSEARAAERGWV